MHSSSIDARLRSFNREKEPLVCWCLVVTALNPNSPPRHKNTRTQKTGKITLAIHRVLHPGRKQMRIVIMQPKHFLLTNPGKVLSLDVVFQISNLKFQITALPA
jgi:hypothetical protein